MKLLRTTDISIKHRPRRKLLFAAAILLGVCLVGYAVVRLYALHQLNFQAYQPGVLPPGIRITRHEVSITKRPGEYYKAVSYSTNTADFGIGEEKSSPQDYRMRSYSCGFLSPDNATCAIYTSPNNQIYSIETVLDSTPAEPPATGKPFEQTISWLKDNTYIWISLSHDQVQKYPSEAWGRMVDAFNPVNYTHERVVKYVYRTSGG